MLVAVAGVVGVQLFKIIRKIFEKSVFPGPGVSDQLPSSDPIIALLSESN